MTVAVTVVLPVVLASIVVFAAFTVSEAGFGSVLTVTTIVPSAMPTAPDASITTAYFTMMKPSAESASTSSFTWTESGTSSPPSTPVSHAPSSLQATDWPPSGAKLPVDVLFSPSMVNRTMRPGCVMTAVSPGCTVAVPPVTSMSSASAVEEVDVINTANATANAAAITSADAPNFRT